MSEEILKDKEEQTEPEAEKAEAGTEKAKFFPLI